MPKSNETKKHHVSKELSMNYFRWSFDDENPGLWSYFGNVLKGQPKVYDTPFARGESTEHMLNEWMDVLESIRKRWPSLFDFEVDLAKKVGPMSVMKPLAQRLDDIDSYYEGILLPSEPVDNRANIATAHEFSRLRGLRPRSQDKTVQLMKKSTNSGSPFFTKRRAVVNKTVPCTILNNREDWVIQRLNDVPWNAAAVLGWRGQEGGPNPSDVKQRVVWMFPFAVNICELQVYQPLIEGSQTLNLVPAWVSLERVDDRITALFDSKSDKDLVVCTDFSKFDQHFNYELQKSARWVLERLLTPSDVSTRWLREVYPVKYMIPLAFQPGQVRFGNHGMGSGSGGTNCDETIAHRALQYDVSIRNGQFLNPCSQCLGDDGMISYPSITVEQVVDAYTAHGLEMNPDKQYASTQDCVYLRRWHHTDYRVGGICVGVYSTCRALGRLRYLERYMDPEFWDERAVALRQLSILENVKWHPLKEQFVDFCMKRDKFRLGLDIPHFFDNIVQIAKEKIEFMPDFLGYTRTLQGGSDPIGGIGQWWIVRYLKSKSK